MGHRRVLTDYSRANRKLRRNAARTKMSNLGLKRTCSHGKGEKSWFAKNWRNY